MQLKVNKITQNKKYQELYNVYFADAPVSITIDFETLIKNQIKKGTSLQIDTDLLIKSITATGLAKYKRYLYSSTKSKKQIEFKLKNDTYLNNWTTTLANEFNGTLTNIDFKNIKLIAIQKIIDQLTIQNLINDDLTAIALVDKLTTKGKPINYIKIKLRQLGLNDPNIDQVDNNQVKQNLDREIQKYKRIHSNKMSDKNFKNNLIASLTRKGYLLQDILSAVDTDLAY